MNIHWLDRMWLSAARFFIFLIIIVSAIPVRAQMPTQQGYASLPDNWLLGAGREWHYKVTPSPVAREIASREPKTSELKIIERAQRIINNGSAKALLLADGDKVVWIGFAQPANENSLFLSASIGKTVTSVAIGAALCEEKMTLDTKVKDVIASLRGSDLGEANVAQLLTMSSGVKPFDAGIVIANGRHQEILTGKLSQLDLLEFPEVNAAAIDSSGKKFLPGKRFSYGSTDPIALGVMINQLTGQTYAKWVEAKVLHPAGIAFSGIVGQDHFGFGASDGNIRLRLLDWLRFATWIKQLEKSSGCLSDFVRAASHTKIENVAKKQGKSFDGYGYLIWTENEFYPDSYWAVGYGGQRIGWNYKNDKVLIAFSNVENYMTDLYSLFKEFANAP